MTKLVLKYPPFFILLPIYHPNSASFDSSQPSIIKFHNNWYRHSTLVSFLLRLHSLLPKTLVSFLSPPSTTTCPSQNLLPKLTFPPFLSPKTRVSSFSLSFSLPLQKKKRTKLEKLSIATSSTFDDDEVEPRCFYTRRKSLLLLHWSWYV